MSLYVLEVMQFVVAIEGGEQDGPGSALDLSAVLARVEAELGPLGKRPLYFLPHSGEYEEIVHEEGRAEASRPLPGSQVSYLNMVIGAQIAYLQRNTVD